MITGVNPGFAGSEIVTVAGSLNVVILKYIGISKFEPPFLETSGATNQNSVSVWAKEFAAKINKNKRDQQILELIIKVENNKVSRNFPTGIKRFVFLFRRKFCA